MFKERVNFVGMFLLTPVGSQLCRNCTSSFLTHRKISEILKINPRFCKSILVPNFLSWYKIGCWESSATTNIDNWGWYWYLVLEKFQNTCSQNFKLPRFTYFGRRFTTIKNLRHEALLCMLDVMMWALYVTQHSGDWITEEKNRNGAKSCIKLWTNSKGLGDFFSDQENICPVEPGLEHQRLCRYRVGWDDVWEG